MTAITRNLPSFIKDPAVSLIGQRCYVSLVENLHVSDVDCLKLAISKGLGIVIVLGGTIMKVPQLLLILRAKHARGLSLPAFVLETLAYLITLIYAYRNSYPFSTYGENFFLTIQNIAITLLIIHYAPTTNLSLTTKPTKSQLQSNSPRVFVVGLCFFLATYALLFIPMSSLQLLQLGTVPISLFSKIPQISENFTNKSTGQLSVFAVASQIFGCAARLFTTATEMGDSLVFAGFALAFVLNLILGVQIWMYWGQGVPSKEHYPKDKQWIKEKEAPLDMPHQPHRQLDQPSFIPVDVPSQSISTSTSTGSTSGGRRWARKVD